MNNLKKEFVVEDFTITSDSINKFEMMENRRAIGEAHVRKINGSLLRGKNPINILIVNERRGRWRLIDGNHRIEAVKRFYNYKKFNLDIEIECVVRVYKNLSDDEEREVYSDEAKRKNESHEDQLNMYKNTINLWKLLQDPLQEFPCNVSIYPSKNSIKFRIILNALATSKTTSSGYYARFLRKDEVITFARECEYDDFASMKKFLTIFQEVFGNVGTDNPFTNRLAFLPLFDIFNKNFRKMKDQRIKERLSSILGKTDIIMYINMMGKEAQITIRQLMIRYMNKGHTINLIV